MLAATLPAFSALASPRHRPWRGVFFNPQVEPDPNYPWLLHYAQERPKVRAALADLAHTAQLNLVDVFLLIPNSLAHPAQGNRPGEPLRRWANTAFLDNVAAFVDDCHAAGIDVELDLVDNRWIPYSVDSEHHIGKPDNPWWPVASEKPWVEAAAWYSQVIRCVEAHARHPESIAMWCMMGNYSLGASEPVLWTDDSSQITAWTERFVKHVWPVFRAAGRRPKASPIMLPIFASNAYWNAQPSMARLRAFTHLKRWLVDDLRLPPDYWVMTTYPFCDPAPDGFRYLRAIVSILGGQNARRIVSTDLKGEGHEPEWRDQVLQIAGRSGADILRWQIAKCRQYGFAGWWMWAYQDTAQAQSGLRRHDGTWKAGLLSALAERPDAPARTPDARHPVSP